MNRSQTPFHIRFAALFLLAAFLTQDAAWAAAERPRISDGIDPFSIRLERANGRVESVHRARGPLVVILRDAHANPGAQKNIAQILSFLKQRHGLRIVFLEGGTRDDSLGHLAAHGDLAARRRVARRFVDAGELSGAESASVTTDPELKLLGVEDSKLYERNLRRYAQLVDLREKTAENLTRLKTRFEQLKRRYYPEALRRFDEAAAAFSDRKTGWCEYFTLLSSAAREHGVNLLGYPNVLSLEKLKALEDRVDFRRAAREWPERSSELSRLKPGSPDLLAYVESFLREFPDPETRFPALSLYREYLQEYSKLDPERLLKEARDLEEDIYDRALQGLERRLHAADRFARLLQSASRLTMTRAEFETFRRLSREPFFRTVALLGFVNRLGLEAKIADVPLVYRPEIDRARDLAVQFYLENDRRDEAMMENIQKTLGEGRMAVLIAGGYHTENLEALARSAGFSTLVVSPAVTTETDLARYEKVLLEGLAVSKSPVLLRAPHPALLTPKPILERAGAGARFAAEIQSEAGVVLRNPAKRGLEGARLTETAEGAEEDDPLRGLEYAMSSLVPTNGYVPGDIRTAFFASIPNDEEAPAGAHIENTRRYFFKRSIPEGFSDDPKEPFRRIIENRDGKAVGRIVARHDWNRTWHASSLEEVYREGWTKIDRLAADVSPVNSEDRALIRNAYILAFLAHQFYSNKPENRVRRAGGKRVPYIVHPVESALSLHAEFARFADAAKVELNAATFAAVLLHDALEDTKLAFLPDAEIARLLDSDAADEVLRLVRRVTKKSGETDRAFFGRMVLSRDEADRESYYKMFFIKLADKLNSTRHDLDLIDHRRLSEESAGKILVFLRQRHDFVKYFANLFYRSNDKGVQQAALYWNEQFLILDAIQRRRIAEQFGAGFVRQADRAVIPTTLRRAGKDLWAATGRSGNAESYFRSIELDPDRDFSAYRSFFEILSESFTPMWENDWIVSGESLHKLAWNDSHVKAVLLYLSNDKGEEVEPAGAYLFNDAFRTFYAIATKREFRGLGATHVLIQDLRDRYVSDPSESIELYALPDSLEPEIGKDGLFPMPASRIEEAMGLDPLVIRGARLSENDRDSTRIIELRKAFFDRGGSEAGWSAIETAYRAVREELLLDERRLREGAERVGFASDLAMTLIRWKADPQTVADAVLYALRRRKGSGSDFSKVDQVLGWHAFSARRESIMQRLRKINTFERVRFSDRIADDRTIPNFMNLVMNLAEDYEDFLAMFAVEINRMNRAPPAKTDAESDRRLAELKLYQTLADKLGMDDVVQEDIAESFIRQINPHIYRQVLQAYVEALAGRHRAQEVLDYGDEALDSLKRELRQNLDALAQNLKKHLDDKGLKVEISYRVKSFEAFYEKRYYRNKLVPDIYGLQVVVQNEDQMEEVQREILGWTGEDRREWEIIRTDDFESETHHGRAHLDLAVTFTEKNMGGNTEIQVMTLAGRHDYLHGSRSVPAHFAYRWSRFSLARLFSGHVEPAMRPLPGLVEDPAENFRRQRAPVEERIYVPIYRLASNGSIRQMRVVEMARDSLRADLETVTGVGDHDGFARLVPAVTYFDATTFENSDHFEMLPGDAPLRMGDIVLDASDLPKQIVRAVRAKAPPDRPGVHALGRMLVTHYAAYARMNEAKAESWRQRGELKAQALSTDSDEEEFGRDLADFARDLGFARVEDLYGAVGSGIYPSERFSSEFRDYVDNNRIVLPDMRVKAGARLKELRDLTGPRTWELKDAQGNVIGGSPRTFRVEGRLDDAGGFGEVWRAFDETSGDTVAVKIFRAHGIRRIIRDFQYFLAFQDFHFGPEKYEEVARQLIYNYQFLEVALRRFEWQNPGVETPEIVRRRGYVWVPEANAFGLVMDFVPLQKKPYSILSGHGALEEQVDVMRRLAPIFEEAGGANILPQIGISREGRPKYAWLSLPNMARRADGKLLLLDIERNIAAFFLGYVFPALFFALFFRVFRDVVKSSAAYGFAPDAFQVMDINRFRRFARENKDLLTEEERVKVEDWTSDYFDLTEKFVSRSPRVWQNGGVLANLLDGRLWLSFFKTVRLNNVDVWLQEGKIDAARAENMRKSPRSYYGYALFGRFAAWLAELHRTWIRKAFFDVIDRSLKKGWITEAQAQTLRTLYESDRQFRIYVHLYALHMMPKAVSWPLKFLGAGVTFMTGSWIVLIFSFAAPYLFRIAATHFYKHRYPDMKWGWAVFGAWTPLVGGYAGLPLQIYTHSPEAGMLGELHIRTKMMKIFVDWVPGFKAAGGLWQWRVDKTSTLIVRLLNWFVNSYAPWFREVTGVEDKVSFEISEGLVWSGVYLGVLVGIALQFFPWAAVLAVAAVDVLFRLWPPPADVYVDPDWKVSYNAFSKEALVGKLRAVLEDQIGRRGVDRVTVFSPNGAGESAFAVWEGTGMGASEADSIIEHVGSRTGDGNYRLRAGVGEGRGEKTWGIVLRVSKAEEEEGIRAASTGARLARQLEHQDGVYKPDLSKKLVVVVEDDTGFQGYLAYNLSRKLDDEYEFVIVGDLSQALRALDTAEEAGIRPIVMTDGDFPRGGHSLRAGERAGYVVVREAKRKGFPTILFDGWPGEASFADSDRPDIHLKKPQTAEVWAGAIRQLSGARLPAVQAVVEHLDRVIAHAEEAGHMADFRETSFLFSRYSRGLRFGIKNITHVPQEFYDVPGFRTAHTLLRAAFSSKENDLQRPLAARLRDFRSRFKKLAETSGVLEFVEAGGWDRRVSVENFSTFMSALKARGELQKEEGFTTADLLEPAVGSPIFSEYAKAGRAGLLSFVLTRLIRMEWLIQKDEWSPNKVRRFRYFLTPKGREGLAKFESPFGARLAAPAARPGPVLDGERIYEKDPDFLAAVDYYNAHIAGKEMTWADAMDLYEIFRGDRRNRYYDDAERAKRLKWAFDPPVVSFLRKVNDLKTESEIVETASWIYMTFIQSPQYFYGRDGFTRVLAVSSDPYSMAAPSNGHHRMAWFFMNHFLLRNGRRPLYFTSFEEYDLFIKAGAARKEILTSMLHKQTDKAPSGAFFAVPSVDLDSLADVAEWKKTVSPSLQAQLDADITASYEAAGRWVGHILRSADFRDEAGKLSFEKLDRHYSIDWESAHEIQYTPDFFMEEGYGHLHLNWAGRRVEGLFYRMRALSGSNVWIREPLVSSDYGRSIVPLEVVLNDLIEKNSELSDAARRFNTWLLSRSRRRFRERHALIKERYQQKTEFRSALYASAIGTSGRRIYYAGSPHKFDYEDRFTYLSQEPAVSPPDPLRSAFERVMLLNGARLVSRPKDDEQNVKNLLTQIKDAEALLKSGPAFPVTFETYRQAAGTLEDALRNFSSRSKELEFAVKDVLINKLGSVIAQLDLDVQDLPGIRESFEEFFRQASVLKTIVDRHKLDHIGRYHFHSNLVYFEKWSDIVEVIRREGVRWIRIGTSEIRDEEKIPLTLVLIWGAFDLPLQPDDEKMRKAVVDVLEKADPMEPKGARPAVGRYIQPFSLRDEASMELLVKGFDAKAEFGTKEVTTYIEKILGTDLNQLILYPYNAALANGFLKRAQREGYLAGKFDGRRWTYRLTETALQKWLPKPSGARLNEEPIHLNSRWSLNVLVSGGDQAHISIEVKLTLTDNAAVPAGKLFETEVLWSRDVSPAESNSDAIVERIEAEAREILSSHPAITDSDFKIELLRSLPVSVRSRTRAISAREFWERTEGGARLSAVDYEAVGRMLQRDIRRETIRVPVMNFARPWLSVATFTADAAGGARFSVAAFPTTQFVLNYPDTAGGPAVERVIGREEFLGGLKSPSVDFAFTDPQPEAFPGQWFASLADVKAHETAALFVDMRELLKANGRLKSPKELSDILLVVREALALHNLKSQNLALILYGSVSTEQEASIEETLARHANGAQLAFVNTAALDLTDGLATALPKSFSSLGQRIDRVLGFVFGKDLAESLGMPSEEWTLVQTEEQGDGLSAYSILVALMGDLRRMPEELRAKVRSFVDSHGRTIYSLVPTPILDLALWLSDLSRRTVRTSA